MTMMKTKTMKSKSIRMVKKFKLNRIAQMDALRFVLVTKPRAAAIDEMREFVLGDQVNESMIMSFNTSFSYNAIMDSFFQLKKKLSSMRKWDQKFDKLYGFTFTIHQFDVWMQDNEGGLNDMVLGLAKLWKNMLKKSDADLGIDAEYTRPGVMCFLEEFKETIEQAYAEPSFIRFNYE
jgi:hypothetical protein